VRDGHDLVELAAGDRFDGSQRLTRSQWCLIDCTRIRVILSP
jgi:hypothetical protein